jgi:hypothetical protein
MPPEFDVLVAPHHCPYYHCLLFPESNATAEIVCGGTYLKMTVSALEESERSQTRLFTHLAKIIR